MGFLVNLPYPTAAEEFPIPRMPMNFSTIENHIRRRAPTLGEHTDSLLQSLGYGQEEIDELRALRVV